MKELSDNAIIEKLRSANSRENDEAFYALYKKAYGPIQRFISNNGGNHQDAEDVFQDGIIILFNHIKTGHFRLESKLNTFLYSICKNIWLKQLRRNKPTYEISELGTDVLVEESLIEYILESEKSSLIAKLIDGLPNECKTILMAFYFDRMKLKEIVKTFKFTNEQIVKNKKTKCMKSLKEKVLGSEMYKKNLK